MLALGRQYKPHDGNQSSPGHDLAKVRSDNEEVRANKPQKESPMRNGMVKAALVGILIGLWTASAAAQQIRFPNFKSMADLQTNGSVQALYNGHCTPDVNPCYVLRLTQGAAPGGIISPYATTTWFTVPQLVNSGFTTYFRFQIHNASCCAPGDGLAFVVQNSATTDTAYGTNGKGGIYAVGVGNGGLGY